MFIRFLCAGLFLISVVGCATTQPKVAQQEQIQSRVTELEKKLEEKDAEIVDLQYEVKDLSSKVDTGGNVSSAKEDAKLAADNSYVSSKSSSNSVIIRVNAAPEDIQSALKAAGVYTGKIDGKIGAGTKAAIVEFQKGHGLKADGVLGKKTWEELKTYLK